MQRLWNNKAPGEDGTPAEVYKSCVDTLAPWVNEVIGQECRDEAVPDDCGSTILVRVYKKRDKARCENFCGISLIDIAAGYFAFVILRWFQPVCDSRKRPN
ncbi:unnamed protein product [Dibothriocephalus latus]|uniref:Uncharacterized protein n=1 Tax=Dibothriocephalus latus TaxID=60516 RepID=A0A3P7NW34_DIBLA|nr:unnamed protein product [Dibothriocephalus latus]